MKLVIVAIACILLISCASNETSTPRSDYIPLPSELAQPLYKGDNSGRYMSPFTSDDVVTDWVERAIDAKIGANLGGAIGSLVGQQLFGEYAFIGSSLVKDFGEDLGYEQALNAAGGLEFIRETSDVSFDNPSDLAIYLYRNYSTHPEYVQVVKATMIIYPELRRVYSNSIIQASRW